MINKIILLLFLFIALNGQTVKIVESTQSKFIAEISFEGTYKLKDTVVNNTKFQKISTTWAASTRNEGEPWLPYYSFNLAVPQNSNSEFNFNVQKSKTVENKLIIPFNEIQEFDNQGELFFDKNKYSLNSLFPQNSANLEQSFEYRFIKIQPVSISPFQYNPSTKQVVINDKVRIEVRFGTKVGKSIFTNINDELTNDFLEFGVLNKEIAAQFIAKRVSNNELAADEYSWYDPNINYYKIFISKTDVYRITYDDLELRFNIDERIPINSIRLYNEGSEIPIDFKNNDSDFFQSGDYFQFVGYKPTPTVFHKQNIYTISNVYWLTFENPSDQALRYKDKNGFPQNYSSTYKQILETVHYEVDSLYERMGLALDDNRDHWYWGRVTGSAGTPQQKFEGRFDGLVNPSPLDKSVTLRVALHGINRQNCNPDHKAKISLTNQPIGEISWDDQSEAIFEESFIVDAGAINIYPSGNLLQVTANGDACSNGYDEIRVNWFQLDYWKYNRSINGNRYFFKSPPNVLGRIRFQVWQWTRNNAKIYIPSKNKMITNANLLNDADNTTFWMDTVTTRTDYFMVANDYYNRIDSIKIDDKSSLRNTSNRADYLIITHPKFAEQANRLAEFRRNNLEGFNSPSVYVADIQAIYDEFSYGMLDPKALQKFVKYTFENWSGTPPTYVVLFGDMSYDYRKILKSSRINYIPSIPYKAIRYGQISSDNSIVCVVGDDLIPDAIIGRMSCETIEEAEILVDKVMNYPVNNSKDWKEKVLLIGAGQDAEDEQFFGFNNSSIELENQYIVPNGYVTEKVFRFPDPAFPDQLNYQGEGPEIREKINDGISVINFYGHGGGYQWDLVFLNDDIYLLENQGKLPLVLSVTCYTGHFENQNVFGEVFNKVKNKGSIAFIGNAGLTFYVQGVTYNRFLFDDLFKNQQVIAGKAFTNSKVRQASGGLFGTKKDHIALLTYLGDPAVKLAFPTEPDFYLNSNQISILPNNPLIGDTVIVKAEFINKGSSFRDTTVYVQFFVENQDTTYEIFNADMESFGQRDSITFKYVAQVEGVNTVRVEINTAKTIQEPDLSDNTASSSFNVFDLTSPKVLKPVNGYFTPHDKVEFVIADFGYYLNQNLVYFIEIDSTIDFSNPLIISPELTPDKAIVDWEAQSLKDGNYFWRARLFDGEKYSDWTAKYAFSVSHSYPENSFGFRTDRRLLKLFTTSNVFYDSEQNALTLNTKINMPKPMQVRRIDSLQINMPSPNDGLTTITTDGTYIYTGNIAYFNNFEPTKIHKIGTGFNGTKRGDYYGTVGDFASQIRSQMFYLDGFIYIPYGDPNFLIKVDVNNGDSTLVNIPDGLMRDSDSRVQPGFFFITTDGKYVYNLARADSLGNNNYFLRILDPNNGWQKVQEDVLTSSSTYQGFKYFFVVDGYIYPYENLLSNFMRRMRASDGFYEEEWITGNKNYYAWCYDRVNDLVYSSVFRTGIKPEIHAFIGKFKESQGEIVSPEIGPASVWNSLNFNLIEDNYIGTKDVSVEGLNSSTRKWDRLIYNPINAANISLSEINSKIYNKLRVRFAFTDSTTGVSSPISLKSMQLNYSSLPEIILLNENLTFEPDSVIQGLPTDLLFSLNNIGYSKVDSLEVGFFLNDADSAFISETISIGPDSVKSFKYRLDSTPLLFENKISITAKAKESEFFDFNNFAENKFFIARDSIRPKFEITFDGYEILNGDLISSEPEIYISLSDNSPLPLDTSSFFIYYDFEKVSFTQSDTMNTGYTEYPNSKFVINWKPKFKDGTHLLEVLAKDASNNYFDTTGYKINFVVDTDNDIKDVYNYPNPFKEDTYFTFNLTGAIKPEEINIKVYTVAGRLIKDMDVDVSTLQFGFNKIYWDGRDQDGNDIANGVYFYKISFVNNEEQKTQIKKLARVR